MQLSLTRSSTIHPVLFAIIPIITIVSLNLDEVFFENSALSFLIIVPSVLVLWYLLNLLIKDRMKSGLIISLGLVLFFSYGHFFNVLRDIVIEDLVISRHRYLVPSFGIIFVVGVYSMLKTKKNFSDFTTIANVIAIVLLLVSISNIFVYALENSDNDNSIPTDRFNYDDGLPSSLGHTPNVYYIILDQYASSKVLKDIFDFDNQDFISQLNERGFHVTENSHSNYAGTILSLTSSLNMEYVNYLTDAVGVDSSDRKLSYQLYRDNNIMNIFKSFNYTLVSSHPFSDYLTLSGSEICINTPFTSQLQLILWKSTILYPVFTINTEHSYADRILCQFSELSTLHNSTKEPFFAYIHFLLPHPPYVFDPSGNLKESQIDSASTLEERKLAYIDQVQFANKKIIETIDKILLESDSLPIIILHGDHGIDILFTKFGENWPQHHDESVTEIMSIFNAYHLPDQNTELIYDSITPVNSFRLILNTYFNANYELLEDRSYFSDATHPYNFTDVTEILLTNSPKN